MTFLSLEICDLCGEKVLAFFSLVFWISEIRAKLLIWIAFGDTSANQIGIESLNESQMQSNVMHDVKGVFSYTLHFVFWFFYICFVTFQTVLFFRSEIGRLMWTFWNNKLSLSQSIYWMKWIGIQHFIQATPPQQKLCFSNFRLSYFGMVKVSHWLIYLFFLQLFSNMKYCSSVVVVVFSSHFHKLIYACMDNVKRTDTIFLIKTKSHWATNRMQKKNWIIQRNERTKSSKTTTTTTTNESEEKIL